MEIEDNDKPVLGRRVRIDYDLLNQEITNIKKQNILNEMKLLQLEKKLTIYENQDIIASNVVNMFKNRKLINIMVVSKTQSGKTGSMCASIKKYLEDSSNLIPIENIYIITGVSSTEWKQQTCERMPKSIEPRVFHRCELPSTFVSEIKEKKDIFIIMDEIQVAAKNGQTLYNTFKKAGLLNKQCLYEKDVKILEYTATPDGTIYDLMKWSDASDKILAEVGEGYVSSYDLYLNGRVKEYKELCGYNEEDDEVDETVMQNIQEIKDDILNYDTPRYHIIRTRSGKEQNITINNFKHIFKEDDYNFINYDRGSSIKNINDLLCTLPDKHTLIFIKEMLRCAKTLSKKYLGVLYERYSKNPDDTVIIQGLIGRDTGYDNNGVSICYTNISSIIKYEKLWNSNFNDKTIKWNSKTTRYLNGQLFGSNTFNDPKHYDGFSTSSDENDSDIDPVVRKYNNQEDARTYLKTLRSGGRGPNKVQPNEDRFYETTIRSIKKVYSCKEIDIEKKQGLSKTNYRLYPCYENINDKTTLQWWAVHY